MYWIAVITALPYFFILLAIRMHLRKLKKHEVTTEELLFISVIIPVRNESSNLPLLLNDLENQHFTQKSFEVIIVDDNSVDDSFSIASAFKGLRNFSVIRNAGNGKKAAIRTGIKRSSGRVIITADADCRLKKGWIGTICSFFASNKPDMLICPVTLDERSGFFGRFQELEFLSLQGITAGCTLAGHPVMCNGANLAYTKEAYLRNAEFMHNEIASGDDIFFLHSLKKEPDAKIMWLESAEATVTTSSSANLSMFIKQRRRWLSKGKAYTDRDTIILAIVTFVTNMIIILLAGISLMKGEFLMPFIIVFIIKVIPDFMILSITAARYGRRPLIKWFLPSAVIYPFYVLLIAVISIFPGKRVSSPSQKEILSS